MKRLPECFGQLPFLRFVAPLRGGAANDIVGTAVRAHRRRPGGSCRRPLAGCPWRLEHSVEWIDKCAASHFRPTPCSILDCDQFTTVTSIFNSLRAWRVFYAVTLQFGHKGEGTNYRRVIARSESDEAIHGRHAVRWIASAFAKASADKSLRSQ